MKPKIIRAADVKPGDVMNFVEHPRNYDRVIRVTTDGDQTKINWFTVAHEFATVKHPDEGVVIWED